MGSPSITSACKYVRFTTKAEIDFITTNSICSLTAVDGSKKAGASLCCLA